MKKILKKGKKAAYTADWRDTARHNGRYQKASCAHVQRCSMNYQVACPMTIAFALFDLINQLQEMLLYAKRVRALRMSHLNRTTDLYNLDERNNRTYIVSI
jgi:hypothetical protein